MMAAVSVDQEQLSGIVEALNDLQEESGIPKNVKQRISEMVKDLENCDDIKLKIHKILSDFDEIAESGSLPEGVRPKIWSISSMLEMICS